MDYRNLHISGYVGIAPTKTLAEVAEQVGMLVEGLIMKEDAPGTYDEYPSFSGQVIGLRFALLGIPDEGLPDPDPPGGHYQLQVLPTRVPNEPVIECDISEFITSLLLARSDLTAWAAK